ncbi:MAG: aminotransferase class III-fold pyridoxal phosphate-dependent enzyme [Actinomycetales bacterium]|nr:aminotransferase class III-fold pyridoxal phosphate-dependent enzyme [Actinomycetales bacterium]
MQDEPARPSEQSWVQAVVGGPFAELLGGAAEVEALPGERDLNAKVSTPHLTAVLKRQAPGDRAWLDLQDRALRSVADAGLNVPRPLHSTIIDLDDEHLARLLTWVEGVPWAEVESSPRLLEALGGLIADVDRSLASVPLTELDSEVLSRPFRWNMLQAASLSPELELIEDPQVRHACAQVLDDFARVALPRLASLPGQLIHNDANDYNVIVADDGGSGPRLGLIDFGDIVPAPRIVGLATAAAYAATRAATRAADPVREVLPLVRGYHRRASLTPEELELLGGLMQVRLAMSVLNAAAQSAQQPGNEYLRISQGVVPQTLLRVRNANDRLTWFRLRDACGYEPNPAARGIRQHLATVQRRSPVIELPSDPARIGVLDWAIDSPEPGPRTDDELAAYQRALGVDVLLGRYGEERNVYQDEAFDPHGASARTIHLGLDLFAPAGSAVFAPLDGVIEAFADNHTWLDYGPVLILRHETDDGTPFWTLMGHLSRASMASWQVGRQVSAGEQVATVGTPEENVGWPPHVHLQVLTDLCGMGTDVYGVAPRDEGSLWRGISPNPALLLGIMPGLDAHAPAAITQIRSQRGVRLSANLILNYRAPLQIVRGEGAYLFDADGRRYLDLVNNVAHVGHANAYVNARAAQQAERLNTNTRYLHHAIVEYASSLASTLPDPLSVVFFVNSGSEANDLAIRLARAHTRARGWISLRHAYHGHTAAVIDVSPYKFLGPGGAGTPSHVRVADLPDAFRGEHRGPRAGAAYAEGFAQALASLDEPLAAFICEGIVSTAGQVTLAEGFLDAAYRMTREAGGICIADEVQIGLGRVGEHFWGFELHGVVPDIVTMGKPLGNGHPLAAVVTSPQIAASFHTGMEYFNTFGGNPVSMAIGQAVLDVVQQQRLQAHAAAVGRYLRDQVRELARRHPLIADVRGHGLFIGVELMRADGTPAGSEMAWLVEDAKEHGVLLSSDGPDNNVLKIKPPMVLTTADVDHFAEVLDASLTRLGGACSERG